MQMSLGLAHGRGDCIGQADALEQAHHFVIEMHRPRQYVGRRVTINHQGRKSRLRREVRRERADRTAADDHQIIGRRHCHRTVSGDEYGQWQRIDRDPLAVF